MIENKIIYIFSNACELDFPNNSLTSFKNKLPINLESDSNKRWYVAVESVGISANFQNTATPDLEEHPSIIFSNSRTDLFIEELVKTFEDETFLGEGFKELLDFPKQSITWSLVYFKNNMRYTKMGIYATIFHTLKMFKWPEITENVFDLFKFSKSSVILMHPYIIKNWNVSFIPKDIRKKNIFIDTILQSQNQFIRYIDTNDQYQFIQKSDRSIIFNGEIYQAFWNRNNKFELLCDLSNSIERNFPKIVKIQSKMIRPQIYNSYFSNDLVVFCPNFKEKDNFLFHEFENKQFVKVNNSIISTIPIKFVDENDNRLHLLPGIASFVKLHFKKMPRFDKSFNVRISSEKTSEFSNNTNAFFKVRLPQTLFLDNEWKVSLTSINHPSGFKSIPLNREERTIDFYNGVNSHIIILPENIPSIKFLGDFLKKEFESLQIGQIALTGSEEVKHLKFLFYNLGYMKIHNLIAAMLGMTDLAPSISEPQFSFLNLVENQKVFSHSINLKRVYIYNSELPININYFSPNFLMLYSNIVNPTIIGGTFCNILKIVPVKKHPENYVITEFKHEEYVDLLNSEINEIEISIRSHEGSFAAFDSENDVILNLHFSNYL